MPLYLIIAWVNLFLNALWAFILLANNAFITLFWVQFLSACIILFATEFVNYRNKK